LFRLDMVWVVIEQKHQQTDKPGEDK